MGDSPTGPNRRSEQALVRAGGHGGSGAGRLTPKLLPAQTLRLGLAAALACAPAVRAGAAALRVVVATGAADEARVAAAAAAACISKCGAVISACNAHQM